LSRSTTLVSHLLQQSDGALGKLNAKVQSLSSLNNLLKQYLGEQSAPYYQLSFYHTGILTILAENAAFATQLRYQVPNLLSQLRKNPTWAGLRSIQVKVSPIFHEQQQQLAPKPVAEKPYPLSKESAQTLLALATSLQDKEGMEGIVDSLKRLAKLS